MSSTKTRIVFIDLLRIIACFLVIVNHTNSQIFLHIQPSVTWFLSISYFFISKIAVPIFIMITGYTMLNRIDTYSKTFQKFLKFVCCLVFFSLLYYVYYYTRGKYETLSITGFLTALIQTHIANAFWYLYLYLGLILMIPFIQRMVSGFQQKDFHVFFCISGIICSIWPILVHYFPTLRYTHYFSLPLFSSYICMLLLGCYLKRYASPSKKWCSLCMIGFIATCCFNVLFTYYEYVKLNGKNYLFFDNRELFPIVLGSVCIFYIASNLHFNLRIQKVISHLGSLTFGVFLISDFLIEQLKFTYTHLIARGIYPLIAMFLYELIVFGIGILITYILKKIPFIRMLL